MFIFSIIYVSDNTTGLKTPKIKHNYSDEHQDAAIISTVLSYLIIICLYLNGLQLCLITSAVNCLSLCVIFCVFFSYIWEPERERVKLVKNVCLPAFLLQGQ